MALEVSEERDMAKFSERKGKENAEKGVRMYPNNGLKRPVRDYDSTFSAVTVLAQMFLAPKPNTGA